MSGAGKQILTFDLAGQLCGIPADIVREVRHFPKRITKVSGVQAAVIGLFNLRGRISAIINLRHCLGVQEPANKNTEMCLVVEYKGELYSLAVDAAGAVLSMDGNIEPVPPMLNEGWRKLVTGVFRVESGLLAVLDIPGLLDRLSRNEKESPGSADENLPYRR